jgi:LuxR family maltose regulon positive regulatory protein
MAHARSAAVVWVPDQGAYAAREGRASGEQIIGDDASWLAWLGERRSFAFQGAAGQLSLLREARAGVADGYWYAYRRHGARTHKRYAGRTADLTLARLEALAQALSLPDLPSAPMAEPPEQLLAPKLLPPRLQPALIARERLLAALDAGAQRALTLLCAPAGYGKTTLARQWISHIADWANPNLQSTIENLQPPAVAWLALDPADNDPIRFWRYLIAACGALQPDSGAAALAQLELPPQPAFEPSPIEAALTEFLNALTRASRPGLLVIDDYHAITARRIHETLTFLVEHLPSTLHLLIISRHPPPLPLARLRARGELAELSAADLRFSSPEMAAFLEQAGMPDLAPTLLRQLGAQLEGWPAGLRLLALALRGSTSPAAIGATLAAFGGSQRTILDFFVAEVLQSQPPRVQDFLLRTSMLRRLSAPLCDALLGTADSAELLAELERSNLFVEPADPRGEWRRYHALFAEAMQAEARRRLGADEVRDISARASRWYERHGLPAEAIEAALHAHDAERAADLLAQLTDAAKLDLGNVHILTHSEFHSLQRWLEQIPDAAMARRPGLFISYATALLFVSLVDQVPVPPDTLAQIDGLLARAEVAFSAPGGEARLGEVFAFRAMLVRQHGGLGEAERWAKRALEHLPPTDLSWRSVALGAIGLGALARGAFDEAVAALQQAHDLCARIGNRWWTRANTAMLSYVLLERGALRPAHARFQQILVEAREQSDHDDVARAQICLALISYEWDDMAAAHDAAAEALALGEHFGSEEIWAQAALVLARAEHAMGQTEAALDRLAALQGRLARETTLLRARLMREARLAQATIELASGNLAAARRWAAEPRPADDDTTRLLREREDRLVARVQIATGAAAAAEAALRPMLASALADGRQRCAIDIRLLLALTRAARGQAQPAAEELAAALLEAAGEGYRRLFLDQGAPMHELLLAVRQGPHDPAARRAAEALLARARPAPGAAQTLLDEPLTQQELRVLRLLAGGHTNPAIARELIVSVNTVRTQVQSIYRKLGVHGRVAATERGRRLGLIPDTI